MDTRKRIRSIVAYAAMSVFALLLNFLFEHTLLGLPLWYVGIISALTRAAITVGTLWALRHTRH